MKSSQRKWLVMGLASGLAMAYAAGASAGAFQLWEQNASGTGDYHAGGAAEANDASTEFYNPAGMVRLKHAQVAMGNVWINTNIPYDGTVAVSTIFPGPGTQPNDPVTVHAQGGGVNFVPDLHYVTPLGLQQRLWFGFGVDTPFGLKTDYGDDTFLRYAGTETSMKTIDVSPSLAWKINQYFSIGAGVDMQYLQGEFDQYGGFSSVTPTEKGTFDTSSINKGDDWGTGWHGGVLWQFTPHTRVGLNYRSEIKHHMTGTSTFTGPLAASPPALGAVLISDDLFSDITLPATTTLSFYHDFNPHWAVLSSVVYTQWRKFNELTLHNVAGLTRQGSVPTPALNVVVHENFRNTLNYALGVHYSPDAQWVFKLGGGYDETPVIDSSRNIQLPDSDKYALAVGVHYQANKNAGFDFGYAHLFPKKAPINVAQVVGPEIVTTIGSSSGSANIWGVQLTWTFI